ncbi:endolytic transglycosylase MltG [Hyphococcus lacteus]|uniref:Endolytic murein transglycosylase n=1 Tax=Hyphococcus lacteus TaxID=3143536 RepID=A0ABV3Z4R7_9PROT
MNSTSKLSRGQRGGAVKSFFIFAVVVGLIASLAIAGGAYFGYREVTKPGPSDEDTLVLLPSGIAVSTIAKQLADDGVIEHPKLFVAAVRIRGVQSALKAGEYRIPEGASVMDVIDLLIEGKSILHFFTAAEGLTTAQIIRLVEGNETLTGEITLSPAEGELLPETFAFTRGETRDAIIKRMMDDQAALIEALWPDRAMELPFATQAEAITLASIVEKETGLPEERAQIASVFVNRLKRGMRLESDPTIIYGLTGGEPLGRGIRLSELRGETPYNTYVINGLPPTPIANPGKASIEAVLNPADTDYIFFVADGTGGHAFASTLQEHNRNVAAWRKIERERAQRDG